ncbi:hypothetical protein F503_05720 [Ophiostoma piceae UAMH 11346]|uniref:Cyclin-like protein n=1 Tax=Ophiostoma piceae (strain UAMH 11346) TaxID=1262450 RepID=S3DAQ0_OPHP1|nr:hypothetical protein F503_05720 [Ophiostoma piceae UAMH 11346]
MEVFTAPPPSQPQARDTDPAPRTAKVLAAAAIDDEDLFLGDDAGDDVENDNQGEDHDEAEDDEDDGFDDDYFASTYRPLSNLPTPPPSSKSSLVQSPSDQDAALESSLLGPAVHLVNMLPPACSIVTPSVPLVQAMLTRAQLPINTIALAVCILDSLDSRFARIWRLTCPLGAAPQTSTAGKRHTLPSPLTPQFSLDLAPTADHRLLHIDAVFPEVIILAALVIAAKFDDDGHATQQPAQAYCTAWSSGASLWTGAQLAATERCIMQSLNYRIMPLLNNELLADACADMRRAGVQTLRLRKMRTATSSSTVSKEQAIMTPPKEFVVAACGSPSPPSLPPSAAPPGLGLQLPPRAGADAALTALTALTTLTARTTHHTPDNAPLSNVKRRHHVPSHSECLGRLTYDP